MERCVWKQKIMYTKEIVFKKEDIPNEETWNFDGYLWHKFSLVDMGITPHTPTQNRTCAINAYGFSLYISYFIYKTNLP